MASYLSLATLTFLSGVATIYAGPYIGQPLYCDRGQGWIYQVDAKPWIALDVGEYTSGRVRCDDEFLVTFANGQTLLARARDAGYLYPHYVEQWQQPIVIDVPAHLAPFPGLSMPATGVNLSAKARQQEATWTPTN